MHKPSPDLKKQPSAGLEVYEAFMREGEKKEEKKKKKKI